MQNKTGVVEGSGNPTLITDKRRSQSNSRGALFLVQATTPPHQSIGATRFTYHPPLFIPKLPPATTGAPAATTSAVLRAALLDV